MVCRLAVVASTERRLIMTTAASANQQNVRSTDVRFENACVRRRRIDPEFGRLIGLSPNMQSIFSMSDKVGQHEYPVLILGESGTGKELLARRVHFSGLRRNCPFVPVDCTSLMATLIESELFGYVKGAFTGAIRSKRGLLEAAQGGTVFFDEIGEMPMQLQGKLLRAVQEREVRPVGSTERRRIDVRVVSATSRDLEAAISRGTFRHDLYFRLNVVQIKIPALRERRTDIPVLVNSFLEKFAHLHDVPRTISHKALTRLMDYDWPGNVRELENVIERAIALSSSSVLDTCDLPTSLQSFATDRIPGESETLGLAELERRAILRAVCETKGDKLDAARQLGIGKTTLYRKLKIYEVNLSAIKAPLDTSNTYEQSS
jgi:transcriptional regulator with PAS, ATPase and Fis domain